MIIIWCFAVVSFLLVICAISLSTKNFFSSIVPQDQNRTFYGSMLIMGLTGAIGLLGSLPGLLYGNWYWFVDQIFSLIS